MNETFKTIWAALCLGMFVLTTIAAYAEISVRKTDGKGIKPAYWIIPGLWAAAFYIFTH